MGVRPRLEIARIVVLALELSLLLVLGGLGWGCYLAPRICSLSAATCRISGCGLPSSSGLVRLSEDSLELITEDLGFSLTVTIKLTILFKGCHSCDVLFSRFNVLPEWLTIFLLG